MKTYTRDEIIKEASGRPETEFHSVCEHAIIYKYDFKGRLSFRVDRDSSKTWSLSLEGLSNQIFTIPADNEKPAELPESVKTTLKQQGWGPGAFLIFTALWAETVKLVEAGKK